MFKVIILVTGGALLSGCGVSSISDDFGGQLAAENNTGAIAAEPAAPPAASAKAASEAKSVHSSQQTSVQASVAAITALSTPGNVAYKIGPQDLLDVSVFKVAELSKAAQVSEAGTINFPLLGEVPAAGKTARELEKDLTSRLGEKYLQNPQVAVIVKEFNSQRVTVEGAVRKPGVFPMQSGMSLLQAVAHAQGLDSLSDNTVVVVRTTNGRRAAARFDVDKIRDGALQDPQLLAGDVVIAGTSAFKEGLSFLKAFPLTSAFALL
jgi:polysaccharide biosynthesis/export protein